jgi:predicted PurR-regulated permease PerM
MGTFTSGRILQFPPLIAGGILCWILAAVSVWFEFDYQSLFAAFAILISYIIPGYLLRRKYSNSDS